jgi:hypothetical protein
VKHGCFIGIGIGIALACVFPGVAVADYQPDFRFGGFTPPPGSSQDAGQLQTPVSIAIGPSGDIYVGDSVNNRLNRFAADGTFISASGGDVIPSNGNPNFEICTLITTCKAGSQNGFYGQLNSVDGIAVGGDGSLFVSEANDNRASQFTAAGDFVQSFGWDVDPTVGPPAAFETCTMATNCQPGSQGDTPGKFNQPNSIAINGSDLYITEVIGGRVDHFTTGGTFTGQIGSPGTGAGQLFGPRGVAVAPDGHLVVGDNGNSRMSEFTANGTFIRAWGFGVDTGADSFEVCTVASTCQAGLGGGAAGQLSTPGTGTAGIAVDANGNIFIADDGNERVAEYAPDLTFIRAWGFDVIPGGDTGFETCTTATGCQAGAACPAASNCGLGQFDAPVGVAIDTSGRVLVVDYSSRYVTRFTPPAPPIETPPTETPPAETPPTETPPTENPPGSTPSNAFTIGKAQRDTKKGTAKLPVDVPGAGFVSLLGKDLKTASKNATGASELTLKVKAKGALHDKLKDKGKAKASVQVTFTPTGGDPNTQSKRVKLKLKA